MTEHTTQIKTIKDYRKNGNEGQPCLIVVSGQGLAHRYWLDGPVNTIGRSVECKIMLNEPNVSRQHARVLALGDAFVVEDLGSTNGTYLNSEKLAAPKRLNDGDLIGIGETVVKFIIQSPIDKAFFSEIIEAAQIDALTGLFNRRYFDMHLDTEFTRIDRYGGALSLLMCDLDDFKIINDVHGHQAGDHVLQCTGTFIRSCLRQHLDIAGRYGGEEMIVLLPGVALEPARTVAEKVRAGVENLSISVNDKIIKTTISIGVASNDASLATTEQLVARADANLLKAKQAGKNRIVAELEST